MSVAVGAALRLRRAACGISLTAGMRGNLQEQRWGLANVFQLMGSCHNAMSPRDTSALCPGTGIKVKGPCAL